MNNRYMKLAVNAVQEVKMAGCSELEGVQLRIAVCDDIPVYVDQLKEYIGRWSAWRGLQVQLATFQNGEEVLFDLEAQGDFNAVFMDVRLLGIDGMEAAARIREQSPQASIIFVSQYREYFDGMFRVYPFQYIEKPVSKQEVFEALDKVLEEQRVSYETFSFRYNRMTYNITLREVLYFASDKRMIRIAMEGGRELVFYEKMDALEKKLSAYDHRFLRIHQSYLVNEQQIEQYLPAEVRLRNGEILPISREKRAYVRQFCMELLLADVMKSPYETFYTKPYGISEEINMDIQ